MYRIKSITYHDGIEKQEESAVRRLGRLIDIDPLMDIWIGKNCFLRCQDFLKSIVTSPVIDFELKKKSGELIIKTINSIYYLEEEKE
jgi:hypothetical protein